MFRERYRELEHSVAGLEARFIQPHIPLQPGTPPSTYDLDVRAFCLLSHAALEQYTEEICLRLMTAAIESWTTSKSMNHVLIALLAFQKDRIKHDDDERSPEVSFYDHIRHALAEIKSEFSTHLLKHNNGVGIKYLRKMLLSVGIDVPDNPKWRGSLTQLTNHRGDQAHRFQVKRIPSPETARDWVNDCLEMCARIRDDAQVVLFRPQFEEDSRHYTI